MTKKIAPDFVNSAVSKAIKTAMQDKENLELHKEFVDDITNAVLNSHYVKSLNDDVSLLVKNVETLTQTVVSLTKTVGQHQQILKTILGINDDGTTSKTKSSMELPPLEPTGDTQKSNKPN